MAVHRVSKPHSASDRQTLIRHPKTGWVCLVISVVPGLDLGVRYSLRADFFDKSKTVRYQFFNIVEAPRTQWTKKGERRLFVPGPTSLEHIKPVPADIWRIDS